MPPDDADYIILRTYSDEMSARIAAMTLEANGIDAEVFSDNAGGMLPAMAVVFPTRLVVRAEDEALARELLDTDAEPPDDDIPPSPTA